MLYFITSNVNKFREVSSILPGIEQLDAELPEIQSIEPREIIEAKLKEALHHRKGEFIVEDTSLYLECINKLPGPFIKFFLQSIGPKGIFEIAEKFGNFKARAVSHLGYARSEDEIYFFEGEVLGEVVQPRTSDFGWNSIFKPDGYEQTFSQMSLEEKMKINHRSRAVKKLKEFLSVKG